MILQSHDGAVHLLPAVPDIWKDGSVSGIVARGGYEFAIKWKNGEVIEVSVLSKLGGNLRLRAYNELKAVHVKPAKGNNPNTLFTKYSIAEPLISEKASFRGTGLNKVYEYDLATRAGVSYKIYKK
ncbi:glycoside hydrolase family 95-like protein [Niabella hibiscisoli]|uniref:glycoside hydrolase family 95-like protein n=1 Tax=Niabella hibiscisoli TaxID=1825928 RepID=UPI00374D6DDC